MIAQSGRSYVSPENSNIQIRSSEIESPITFQNADFSLKIIKELVSRGEGKINEELTYCEKIR